MTWIKDNKRFDKPNYIIHNGKQYINPSKDVLLEAGYVEVDDYVETLDDVKQNIINDIDEYDCSSEVNLFYYNDEPIWIDKATRVGLTNAIQMLRIAGEPNIDVWFGDNRVNLPLDTASNILSAIEIYALQCYNVTAMHKHNVKELDNIDDVYNYNYMTGYPEKLHF